MTKDKQTQTLEDLAFELDFGFGILNLRVATLNDIKYELSKLRLEMDETEAKDANFRFNDFHRRIRLLNDLLGHTVNGLNKEFEETENTKTAIFDKVV